MGIFGAKKEPVPPHPRREPRFTGLPTAERVAQVFGGSVDFGQREFWLNNDPAKALKLCYVAGQVRAERACDYVLRPMAQNNALGRETSLEEAYQLLKNGGVYAMIVMERTTLDEVVFDLMDGWLALFFPHRQTVLTYWVATEEKRSVSPP